MLTLGELSNRIDALKQLRRFNPDVPVYVDGVPVESALEMNLIEEGVGRPGRAITSVGFSLRTKDEP